MCAADITDETYVKNAGAGDTGIGKGAERGRDEVNRKFKRKRNSSENQVWIRVRHKVLRSGEQGRRMTLGIALPSMHETVRF